MATEAVMDKIISAVVGFLLIGYVGPIGVLALANATGFTAGGTLATLFTTVMPIIATIVFFLIIVSYLRGKSR